MNPQDPRPELVQTARRSNADLVGWRLDRLRAALAGPLCVIGAGGSAPAARLWATLHAATGAPAWCISPLELREVGLPKDTAVLFLSASGRHHDILGAADAALAAGHRVHAVTSKAEAPLVGRLRQADPGHQTVVLTGPAHKEGLAARHATVPMALLAGRLYEPAVGPELFVAVADDAAGAEALGRAAPRDVVVLGAGLARPAADAFAHLMRESGLAPARATDPRDFAHGAFMAVGPDTRLVVFGHGAQSWLQPFVEALPAERVPLYVRASNAGPAAAVALYGRALNAADVAMHAAGALPGKPDIAPWSARIYRLPVG